MKKTFFFIFNVCMYVCISIPLAVVAQDASTFDTRMQVYTENYIEKNAARYTSRSLNMEEGETITEEDFKLYLTEEAKSKFIHENMKEYLNIYFPTSAMVTGTDTLVCDNGGFEDGFLYYEGYTGLYSSGGITCTPYYGSNPTDFTLVPIPSSRHFEIVTAGKDDLTGIDRVKFGEKAALINNKYGHGNYNCKGDYGIDKLVKRFKVTDSTLNFSVWYAVVLENPDNHNNRQPFLSIKCDRAPQDDLCFDADSIECTNRYPDEPCYTTNKFNNVKVQDWTCQIFHISEEFIDSIATLEITVADCGKRDHAGYAYIDGICEPCYTCSPLSINYVSCFPDEVATVYGKYSLNPPHAICDEEFEQYKLIDIIVPGYQIENLQIFSNNTFSFEFPKSNFSTEDCINISAEIYYLDEENTIMDQSCLTEICSSLYEAVDCSGGGGTWVDTCDIVMSVDVGGCNSNGTGGDGDTDTTPNISDDYYYVYVTLLDPYINGWYISRDLVDPYPNEDDIHDIAYGEGDTTSMILGPFLIQEGDWWLEVHLPGCDLTEYIEAPDYCSGCDEFNDAEIGNVTCIVNSPDDPSDDMWSFTLKVPNDNSPLPPGIPLRFKLFSPSSFGNGNYNYNQTNTITNIPITSGCLEYELSDLKNSNCKSSFKICPPKLCNDDCRDFNIYVEKVECIFDPRTQQYTGYEVLLDISGIHDTEQKVCISYLLPGSI
ncbi:MAG: hypothetical protein R2771_11490, partial [Saprospiraceae bacterium]